MVDMLDFLEGKDPIFVNINPSFLDLLKMAGGFINQSARCFEAMNRVRNLESLGEHFDYGISCLESVNKLDSKISRDYPEMLDEFRDLIRIRAKQVYQKL